MQCLLFTLLTFFAPIDSSVTCTFQARILDIYEYRTINKEEAKELELDTMILDQISRVKMKIRLLNTNQKNIDSGCTEMVGKEGDISVLYNNSDDRLTKGAIVNLDFIVIGGFAYYGIPPSVHWRIVPRSKE